MTQLSRVQIGAWGGGRFMNFGQQIEHDQLIELLRPNEQLSSVVTADVYGAGECDQLVAEATAGIDRSTFQLVGSVGHDFYNGVRQGAKGFPRFTDPSLRSEDGYRDYLFSAVERSLERCKTDHFDLLMLHNPDRIGYNSPVVWQTMAEIKEQGLAKQIGVAPGPANGFTLDVIGCIEKFGSIIDWAMVILGPLEPWPGGLVLPVMEQNDVKVLARVVDYGGLFWGDLHAPEQLHERDHRAFRPAGWIEAGNSKAQKIAEIGESIGLSRMQTALAWTLSQPAVASVVPTLIQEKGQDARDVFAKKAELAQLPESFSFTPEQLQQIAVLGDNRGSMALKGASPVFAGDGYVPDQWAIGDDETLVAERWAISPEKQLVKTI